jgi:hypothetical protein
MVQTLEDGTVVGQKRSAAGAAFAPKLPIWAQPQQLQKYFAKYDESRKDLQDLNAVAQVLSTYAKNTNALADLLRSLYGTDPRAFASAGN